MIASRSDYECSSLQVGNEAQQIGETEVSDHEAAKAGGDGAGHEQDGDVRNSASPAASVVFAMVAMTITSAGKNPAFDQH